MKVKNWLMDMQDTAYSLLAQIEGDELTLAEARALFNKRWPNQERIFNACLAEYADEF